MAQEFEGFSVMLASWIETQHIDKMKKALNHLQRANNILEETRDNVERFCQ